MEKLAIGLHGWSNRVDQRLWRPQAAELFGTRGYKVVTPEIDAPDIFDINLWEERVDGLIIPAARDRRQLAVFSQSNSAQFILNSAAKLQGDEMIDFALLVAPYLELRETDLGITNPDRYESARRIYDFAKRIDLTKAGAHIRKTVLLFSQHEDDPYIDIERNIKLLTEGLGSNVEVVRITRAGHFITKIIRQLPGILDRYLGPIPEDSLLQSRQIY